MKANLLITMAVLLWTSLRVLAAPIDDFLDDPAIDGDAVGVVVTDIATGKVIAEWNPEASLLPASILKGVTVASLMSRYDIDYQYRTPIWITGKISGTSLLGNLLIEGSGDPTLNSPKMQTTDIVDEIAGAIKRKGIFEIRGDIIFDESVFSGSATPTGWTADDKSKAYGTGAHAINFENNASGNQSVGNPSAVLKSRLVERLDIDGIKIIGEEIKNGKKTLLFTHLSPPLDDIMRSCMMRSDNLFAECFQRQYAIACGETGSTEKGARLVTKLWKERGLNMKGVSIHDGSGLSRENRVTPLFMTQLLMKMSVNPDYVSYYPLVGCEGTVKNFLKDTELESYMALKTGTLNNVMCFAGYKLNDDFEPTHTVVLILNKLPKGRDSARQALKTLLTGIFQNN